MYDFKEAFDELDKINEEIDTALIEWHVSAPYEDSFVEDTIAAASEYDAEKKFLEKHPECVDYCAWYEQINGRGAYLDEIEVELEDD